MVRNRWDESEAKEFLRATGNGADDGGPDVAPDLAARLYCAHLIGQDPDLVQHGGGNVSVKLRGRDLMGREIEVLRVKGSGRNLGEITAEGLPALRLAPLQELRGLDHLDDFDMINALRANLLDYSAPNPSVETLLHAFLPHRFIDHTHATAMLALANLPDPQAAVAEIFGPSVVCVPFLKSGFDLARAAADIYDAHPEAEGLLLINHGHFAFGDSARQSYDRLIAQTNAVEAWLAKKAGPAPRTDGESTQISPAAREVLPLLRGVIGDANAAFSGDRDAPMPVLSLRNGENVQAFLQRDDLAELAVAGSATPDHVIRTKNLPLLLDVATLAGGRAAIEARVAEYIDAYAANFEAQNAALGGGYTMLPPSPNVAWIEGVGIVGIGADARAAAAISDLAAQNIEVMRLASAAGGFAPLAPAQVFEMEYWALEQAKVAAATRPPMQGRVVMVTGGAGAIGLATAREFAALGADIFLIDLSQQALDAALPTFGGFAGGLALDITAPGAAGAAMDACVRRFGGLDILVSNAGAAWTGEMTALPDETLRKSFELNFFAHQTFAKAAALLFAQQGRGGQLLFNVSKQAVNPGKGFGAYGLPKAATFFLLRQLALELGPAGVRVNGINADRIRSGLLDEAFVAERAKARGISEETYMAGNLLRREVEARHVGQAFLALAQSERTTAHVMTVDGGNIEAALR